MRKLLNFFSSYVSWLLANITTKPLWCFQNCDQNSGHSSTSVCLNFWAEHYLLMYSHHWDLINSMGSNGSYSWCSLMKVIVWYFVCDSQDCDHTHSAVAGTDSNSYFEVLVWSFLCNLIDVVYDFLRVGWNGSSVFLLYLAETEHCREITADNNCCLGWKLVNWIAFGW